MGHGVAEDSGRAWLEVDIPSFCLVRATPAPPPTIVSCPHMCVRRLQHRAGRRREVGRGSATGEGPAAVVPTGKRCARAKRRWFDDPLLLSSRILAIAHAAWGHQAGDRAGQPSRRRSRSRRVRSRRRAWPPTSRTVSRPLPPPGERKSDPQTALLLPGSPVAGARPSR
jgi:hypothetical protein